MKRADLVQLLEAHGCYLELPAAGYATPLHTEIFAGSRVAMRPGTRIDANHQDVMRSIELLGTEVIPALHELKLQPYEEAGASAVLHR